MTLSEIIERLGKATGPNYALEREIQDALEPDRKIHVPRPYTSSVDAAIALAEKVLPGEPVNMGWAQTPETRPWARVGAWSAPDATGPTPALALTTAIVSALRDKEVTKP